MKRLLALLLPVMLAACATAPPPHIDVPEIARSQGVAVRDERPAGETERKPFSYLITSDAYGILRNGELGIDPPVLRLLQHRVFERSGPDSHVTVHHFVTYQNIQSQLRGIAVGSLLGPIGVVAGMAATSHDVAMSATRVDRAAFEALTGDNEWKRGVVTATENPQKGATLVTFLDAEVNGKQAFVRVVSPAVLPDGRLGYADAVEATIRQLLGVIGSGDAAVPATAAATSATATIAPPSSTPATNPPTASSPTSADSRSATARPANARHLDASMLQGHTWTFPHLRDPARYGQVRLQFADGIAHASNAAMKTAGPYTVKDDMLCIDFASPAWGHICYYVLDADPGNGTTPSASVLAVFTGRSAPLTIQ